MSVCKGQSPGLGPDTPLRPRPWAKPFSLVLFLAKIGMTHSASQGPKELSPCKVCKVTLHTMVLKKFKFPPFCARQRPCKPKQVWGHSASPGAQVEGGREVTCCKHALCGSGALASSSRTRRSSCPQWHGSQDPEEVSIVPALHSSAGTPGRMHWPQAEWPGLLSYVNPTLQAP